jgi:hypothetical protein
MVRNKIIPYVKDEGSNLNTLTNVLNSVVKCETFGLEGNFQGTCFGHVFSKACQYAIIDEKVCKNLKYAFIKFVEIDLQKCITWPKKFGEGHQEWNKIYIEVSLKPKNLNIPLKIRLVMFFVILLLFHF